MRAPTNAASVVASDASSADSTNSAAAHSSTFLRPSRSLNTPAQALPTSAPQPSELPAQPSRRSPLAPRKSKYSRMKGATPEITVASNPSSRPPIAAVSATKPTFSWRCPMRAVCASLLVIELFLVYLPAPGERATRQIVSAYIFRHKNRNRGNRGLVVNDRVLKRSTVAQTISLILG